MKVTILYHDFYVAVYEDGVRVDHASTDYLHVETVHRMYKQQGADVTSINVDYEALEDGAPATLEEIREYLEGLGWTSS